MSYWEREIELALTSQRGYGYLHGSRFEETHERLSSLIRQKYLHLGWGTYHCYWVLLADSSTDRFVILQGIPEGCWLNARNDEFKLVAAGNTASEDRYAVFWPGAKDLARVAHKIMRKKIIAANDSDIVQECALHGLLICHLVGNEARFFRRPPRFLDLEMQSLELEIQMLSRVLKPPSVLAAAGASPSLLAQGPLDTAASSTAPLAIVSVGMDSHPSEAAGYERQELAMHSPSSSSGTRNLHNLLPQEQQLVVAPPHFITRSSGGRGRNGGGPPDFIELLAQCLGREYLRSQQRPDYDLEAGGQAHRVGGGAAAPVQQPPVKFLPPLPSPLLSFNLARAHPPLSLSIYIYI